MKINWHYILLQIIVFVWGFTGILGKVIGSNVMNVLVYRTGISTILLWIIWVVLREKIPNKKDFLCMLFSGFLLAISWMCFFESARLANVSISVIGLASSPVFVVFVQSCLGSVKKKLLLSEFFLAIISVLGIYIIFSEKNFNLWNGLFLSILSGFFTACYVTMSEKLVRRTSHITIITIQISAVFFVVLATLLVMQYQFPKAGFILEPLNYEQWIYELIFAIGCTVIPMILSTWIMKKLSAFAVTLSVNIEPVYTIIWATYFFPNQEIMGYNFYIGAFVLVLSVILYPFIKKHFDHTNIVRKSMVRVRYITRKYAKK